MDTFSSTLSNLNLEFGTVFNNTSRRNKCSGANEPTMGRSYLTATSISTSNASSHQQQNAFKMDSAFQPQIILLREGTDTSQGKSQIISNINACQAVAETVRTTLGPRGMDKLVFDGQRTTISNDGATIMRLLDIVHPAAKTLVDISMAQV